MKASYQGVKRLFALFREIKVVLIESQLILTEDTSFQELKLKTTTSKLMEKIFYDQSITDLIKQYDEVRKVSTGQSDYATACLLDCANFEKKYRLIVADLSKQKALDADSRAIQQIILTGKANAGVMTYNILEQSKEKILQLFKGTTKVL